MLWKHDGALYTWFDEDNEDELMAREKKDSALSMV
jgi:hypothetical protein